MKNLYETVIGLEVHVELATATKLFCGCTTAFGGAPNTHTCPVCTGMPGSLPVLNKKVVDYAIAVGLATNCEITRRNQFDRKNYFYPDNPQNYQISQLYLPICRNGSLEIDTVGGKKSVGIHEIHMEEDAGKLVHDEWTDSSLVDYNRSGVPLLEIVSEPDMRSAEEVIDYLSKLRLILIYLGVSDCRLQEGSMRADVNLSVHQQGTPFGTRTEMKNLNSFKAISRAIANERERQIELLEEGKQVIQETRRWDDNKESSYAMRSKEDAKDYRYFPEPDLVPLVISEEWIQSVREHLPEFRDEKIERYRREYDLSQKDILLITSYKRLSDLLDETARLGASPKKTANRLMVDALQLCREREMDPEELTIRPEALAELIGMTEEKLINSSVSKEIFEKMLEDDINPRAYVMEHQLQNKEDDNVLIEVIERVLAANPQSVEDYLGGKTKAIGFLVGQAMKETKGTANPERLRELLEQKIK